MYWDDLVGEGNQLKGPQEWIDGREMFKDPWHHLIPGAKVFDNQRPKYSALKRNQQASKFLKSDKQFQSCMSF